MPFKLLLLSTLCVVSTSFAADTVSPNRSGYSFFGAGFDVMDYEENTAYQVAGETIDVETGIGINFTQQSGAYVAVSNDWGFYLTTSSTLGESSSDEEWKINDAIVRKNKVAFERQRISALASYRFSSSGFWLFGGQYGSSEFKRFAAELTDQAQLYGIEDQTFSDGTVSEKVWELDLFAGYEWNRFFDGAAAGWRHQVQLLVGVPLYSSITNTEVGHGRSFNDSFNGLQMRVNAAYGYQFNRNVLLAFGLETGYAQRDPIRHNYADDQGVTEFPENQLLYIYPSLTAYWSF